MHGTILLDNRTTQSKELECSEHDKQQVILKFQLSSCRTTEIEFKHVETCGCEESCLKLNRSRQTTTTNDCENFATK